MTKIASRGGGPALRRMLTAIITKKHLTTPKLFTAAHSCKLPLTFALILCSKMTVDVCSFEVHGRSFVFEAGKSF